VLTTNEQQDGRRVSEVRHRDELKLAWSVVEPDGAVVGLGGCAAFSNTSDLASFGFITRSGSAFVAFFANPVRVRRVPTTQRVTRIEMLVVDEQLRIDTGGDLPTESFRVVTSVDPEQWSDVRFVKCVDGRRNWAASDSVLYIPKNDTTKAAIEGMPQNKEVLIDKPRIAFLHRPGDRDDYVSCPPIHQEEMLDLDSGKEYRWFSHPTDKVLMRDLEQHQIRRIEDLIGSTPYAPMAMELFRRAATAGFNLFVVGGAVREAVLGERPEDLDLAGDVPPSMFRKWVRELGARYDRDLVVRTSANNVTHVQQRNSTDELVGFVEYGFFKYEKVGRTWVGCNDLREDYRTRDTAENSLMYDVIRKKVVSASDRLDDWTTDGKLDADKFRLEVTPILGHKDSRTKIHESFDKWGYINLLARITKTCIRLTPKNAAGPDATRTAVRLRGIGPDLRSDLLAVADVFGVTPSMLLAAAVLEAEPRGGQAALVACDWLNAVLVQAVPEPPTERDELVEWMKKAKAHLKKVSGPEARLIGDGLLKVTKGRNSSWVADPAALSLFTSFTPKHVAEKLKGLIAGWELYAVPISLGTAEPVVARAWRNPERGMNSFLVEVDGGALVSAGRDIPAFEGKARLPGVES